MAFQAPLRPALQPAGRCAPAFSREGRDQRALARRGLGPGPRRQSEQDAAIFLTAAFTGLRQGELLTLHWRDVDFERRVIRVHRTYKSGNGVGTPKSGRGRSVPMADEVALALARLGEREQHTGDDDLVFCGPRGHVNAQKLGYRYKASTKRACFGQPSGSTGAIGNICGPPEPMPAQFGLSAFCTVRRLASVNEQTAIDLRLELAREQD